MRNLIAFLFLSLFTQEAPAVPTLDGLDLVPGMFRELLVKHNLLLERQRGDDPEGKHQIAKFLALYMVDFSVARSAVRSAAMNAARSAAEFFAWKAAGKAAWDADFSAAWSAAWDGSGDTAYRAAWDSSGESTFSAARDTTWSAAWKAAWSAAWKAGHSAVGDAAKLKVLAGLRESNLMDPAEIGQRGYKFAEYFVLDEMLMVNKETYEKLLEAAYNAALSELSDI